MSISNIFRNLGNIGLSAVINAGKFAEDYKSTNNFSTSYANLTNSSKGFAQFSSGVLNLYHSSVNLFNEGRKTSTGNIYSSIKDVAKNGYADKPQQTNKSGSKFSISLRNFFLSSNQFFSFSLNALTKPNKAKVET